MAHQYRDFMGAKLALFVGNRLLVLQRDNTPGLLWPGFWDLPGGGREGFETPLDCVLRETEEEFCLTIPRSQVTWARAYTNSIGQTVWFFVGCVSPQLEARVRLGEEGQGWDMLTVPDFLARDTVVPQFKPRLVDYLRGMQRDILI